MRRRLRLTMRVLMGVVAAVVALAIILTHAPAPGPIPKAFPHLARHPARWLPPTTRLATLPRHVDDKNAFQVDLRAADLAALDITSSSADLDWAVFDSG